MKWTHAGRVMRATAQDRDAATLMGIDTDRVYRLTFAIGIAAVGAAGVLVAPLYSVYPTAGLQFVLLSYVVVVLGGLGDMFGAMLGSLIVAAVEVAGSYLFGTAWKEIFYFVLFIAGSRLPPGRALRPARSGNPGRLSMIARLRRRPGAVALFGARGPDTAGRPRRLLSRQPRADSPVGRAVGGLERGRRLRGPGLDRPRVVLRHRRVLRRP